MSTDRVIQYTNVHNEAFELFKKKNKDYGDAFADYGSVGVLVRLGDKIRRMQSITASQIKLINTESLRDTLIDLHNYSAMAIMLMDEKEKLCNSLPTPPSPSHFTSHSSTSANNDIINCNGDYSI